MQNQSDSIPAVGSELLADAKGVGTSAVNRLYSEADARKGDAAAQVKSVSSAIEKTGDGLGDQAPTWLKSAFEQGALRIQTFAETLEQKDSRQLLTDVSDFARGSPGTFLAACAVAGFAAARIFKAGGSENTPAQPGAIGTDYRPSNADQSGQARFSSTPRGEFA